MNLHKCILVSVLIFSLFSCENEKTENKSSKITEKSTSTDFHLDHFNIWVNDPIKSKKRLEDIGFTIVPDSLSEIHHGQGTSGRYINFLNGYLELIFVYNQDELEENNKINSNLDFIERANFEKNNASPFSISLKMEEYKIEKIPFEKVKYHQTWMEKQSSIYCAKSSKKDIKEPSIFVVYPELESAMFESTAALDSFPSEDEQWKKFFKHPNGAEKLTNIIVTSTSSDLNSETMKTVNGVKNLTVKSGTEHLMELFFDNNVQGKSFDLRPQLPLIVYL